MLRKIIVKNPGCRFCRHYLASFVFDGKDTVAACTKGGKKIFQRQLLQDNTRNWKWVRCSYAKEKNRNRLCADFSVHSQIITLVEKMRHRLHRAERQLPPSFEHDIWWKT